jgi:mevalonate kinase
MTAPVSVSKVNSPASHTRLRCTRVRVPGKVILSGEHAVVYGAPALACAIQIYAFAKVTSNELYGVHLKVPEFGIDQQFSYLQLDTLAQQTQSRHRQFVANERLLSSVVSTPEDFLAAALGASGLVNLLSNQDDSSTNQATNLTTGLTIELTMDLVAGGGMGSSAALVAAMLAASFKHLDQPLTLAALISKTTQSEHWQHGRSSGLDPYVCVMGGVQQYQKGLGQRQMLKPLAPCFLVTTGKPLSSTGECVEYVKQQNFPLALWSQFEIIQENLRQCMLAHSHGDIQEDLDGENMGAMLNAICANHKLLQHIGVVPSEVAKFIANIEANAGAAKICGAGSIVGNCAGLVFVTGLTQAFLEQLCLSFGYDVQVMQLDLDGVRYLD